MRADLACERFDEGRDSARLREERVEVEPQAAVVSRFEQKVSAASGDEIEERRD